MRKLNLFQKFDFASFIKDKQFMIQAIKYNEKKGCLSADIVITSDETDYGDPSVTNLFERFKVHLIGSTENDLSKYAPKDLIIFKSFSKATVWGEYMNNLSVEGVIEVVK